MVYSPNIPQPSDDPSQSQDLILQNFQSINTVMNVNHENFDTVDQGKHKFVQMPQQASDASTGVTEGAIYTKDKSGITEAYYRTASSGNVYQLSGIKAFCAFDGNLGGTISPINSMNVTNITKIATGRYRINFTNPLPNSNYTVISTGQVSDTFGIAGIVGVGSRSTTSTIINVRGMTSPVGADLSPINIMVLQ